MLTSITDITELTNTFVTHTLGDNLFFKLPQRLVAIFTPTETLLLQQLHHYLHSKYGAIAGGTRWIYNTYEQWQAVFPGLTARQIRYAFNKLRSAGVVVAKQLEKHKICGNRRNWYTINYKVLEVLLSQRFFCEASDNCVSTPDESVISANNSVSSTADFVASSYISKENEQRLLAEKYNSRVNDAVEEYSPGVGLEQNSLVTPEDSDCKHNILVTPENCIHIPPDGMNTIKTPLPPTPLAPCDNNMVGAHDNNTSKPIKTAFTKDFEYKLYLVQEYAEIQTNTKLEQQIDKYSYEEVQQSVDCYQEWVNTGKVFINPQGWLVECLKGKWWQDSPSKQEKRRVEAVIKETLKNWGYEFKNWEGFAADYWQAVEDGAMHDFDEREYRGDRAGQLLVNESGVWVRGLNDDLEEEWQDWNDFVKGL